MPFAVVNTGGTVFEVNGGTGVVTANRWPISRIRWVSKSASSGDTCVVTDTAGNLLFESNATGANWDNETAFDKTFMAFGVKVSTLSSGNIYITVR